MYKPIDSETEKKAKEKGHIVINISERWSGAGFLCFVPHSARYVSKVFYTNNVPDSIKIANFYVTVEGEYMKLERLTLANQTMAEKKDMQHLFLKLLIGYLPEWVGFSRRDNLLVESTHPDIAGIMMDQGYEISKIGENYRGKYNVQNTLKKAKMAD